MKTALGDSSGWFVGTWSLVSLVGHAADGCETADFGSTPRGFLIYDRGGRMSVHVTKPDRKAFKSGDPSRPDAEELKDAFDSYFGYFGTYAVDESAGTVTHYVEGASNPNYADTDQRRFFTWQGDRLVLRAPVVRIGEANVTYVATWERLP